MFSARVGWQFVAVFSLLISALSLSGGQANRVIVLVNSNEPKSLRIAKHYMDARAIPQENMIALPMSVEETITLTDYVATIHNPLIEALIEKDWVVGVKSGEKDFYGRTRMAVAVANFDYLVTTSGVPLRIKNDPERVPPEASSQPKQFRVNNAAVDSELAVMIGPPDWSMTGYVLNPLFGKKTGAGPNAARIIKVSRLDGPSVDAVTRLIDRSIEAERSGLSGRAYVDLGGPHERGNEWIENTAKMSRQVFFDTDVERSKRLMDDRDRLDAPAIYMGWYKANAAGPWRRTSWSVPPGAIGFHLHSFSATTVRSVKKGWVAPLIAQGYCATVGNVYEPYLDLTHRPDALLGRLMEGATFGEAVAFANPSYSWQTMAIGDPLYRPFALGLDAQLKLESDGPYTSYVHIREMNRQLAQKGAESAIEYGRAQFVEQPSLALAFRLAELYLEAGEAGKAVEVLGLARYMTTFPREEVILAQKVADLLDQNGASGLALEVYKRLVAAKGLPKKLRVILLENGAKVATRQLDTTLASQWRTQALRLKPPPKTQ